MTIEEYKKRLKKQEAKKSSKSYLFMMKLMVTILITICCLIVLKVKPEFKTNFYKYVFDDHISFVEIKNTYEKYLKDVLPFKDMLKTEPVFDEKLVYSSINKYKDGSKLTVTPSYLVPILEAGMVIYVGEKEEYGNTVIIEQINGLEVWYSNLKNINVKLYDYVDKGNLLGEVDDELYIIIKKDGEFIDYEDVF